MKGYIVAPILALVLMVCFQNCSTKGAPPEEAAATNNSSNSGNNCQPGELPYQGQCFAQYLPCTSGGGTGQQEFSNGTYGACQVNTCPAANHVENGICVSNTKACNIPNGTGSQTWNGTMYNACVASACNASYRLEGNACLGPVVNIYRYTANIYSFFYSTTNNDPAAAPRALEGLKWSMYGTSQPGSNVPLYRCDWANVGNLGHLAMAHTNCTTAGSSFIGTTGAGFTQTVLGYVSPTQGPGMKPLYFCTPLVLFSGPRATVDLAECTGPGATTLGYVF